MLTIKLVDARKNLHEKCVELFHNEKVAESIYMYLCDGIEECDEVEPEQKTGEWIRKKELVPLPWDCSPLLNDDYDADTHSVWQKYYHCSNCDWKSGEFKGGNFCPNCGADMRGEQNE